MSLLQPLWNKLKIKNKQKLKNMAIVIKKYSKLEKDYSDLKYENFCNFTQSIWHESIKKSIYYYLLYTST